VLDSVLPRQKFSIFRTNKIFKILHAGHADDRRGDPFITQAPGDRYLRHADPALLRYLFHSIQLS
jgi:hypothetical protein